MEGRRSSALFKVNKEVCLYFPAFGQWRDTEFIFEDQFKEPDILKAHKALKVVYKLTDCLWTGEDNDWQL